MSAQLHLNAFLMTAGHHEAAWRLPESDPVAATGLDHFIELARIAERGGFDSLFLADSPVLQNPARRPASILEPTLLLAALATATSHIGLIATASTSYNDPYNLARRFASLDHISGGRAGWNIVTTAGPEAARNFGLADQPAHGDRYRRAAEFVEVCTALWDGWGSDAVVADKERGVWAEPDRVRPAAHRGEFFAVHGPLNVSRSPQGRPLLVQAGSSEDGRAFAARYADAVFTAHQTLRSAQDFAADLRARTAAAGRDPARVKVLPGIVPIIGDTEADAAARASLFDEQVRPEYARAQLARTFGVAVEELDLDAPLPAELPAVDEIEGARSRYALIVDLARSERLTVRELILRLGGGRGHHTFVGTAEQVADVIETWYREGAADGFNIMPPALPADLSRFVDQVVPILRRRGLFRTEYTDATLRERYGLADATRPATALAG